MSGAGAGDGTATLCWRVEDACMNAAPCTRQLLWQPWLLRLQGGSIRRVNSINPLRADRYDIGPLLRPAGALFARHGLPLIVRVPDIAGGLDEALRRRGFGAEGETCTLYAERPVGEHEPGGDGELRSGALPDADWLAARHRLSPAAPAQRRSFETMLAAIAGPARFAALRPAGSGEIAAIAYGAIHDRLLVVESVVTDLALRRRGYGRRVVAALLAWSAAQGAPRACLQVVADNAPARALYRELGFDRELYRYRYRRAPC